MGTKCNPRKGDPRGNWSKNEVYCTSPGKPNIVISPDRLWPNTHSSPGDQKREHKHWGTRIAWNTELDTLAVLAKNWTAAWHRKRNLLKQKSGKRNENRPANTLVTLWSSIVTPKSVFKKQKVVCYSGAKTIAWDVQDCSREFRSLIFVSKQAESS